MTSYINNLSYESFPHSMLPVHFYLKTICQNKFNNVNDSIIKYGNKKFKISHQI